MNLDNTQEDKRKHLDLIQGVINRMASNSFLFKGWSITIIAGVAAFAAKEVSIILMVIPLVSTLLFWGVDSYYLTQERLFRGLYEKVIKLSPSGINYEMKTDPMTFGKWFKSLWRPVLLAFYGTVVVMLIVLGAFLAGMQMSVSFNSAA